MKNVKATAAEKKALAELIEKHTPLLLTSLADLTAKLEAPLKCRFELDGQVLELDVKRLTPGVAERQRAILRAVQPPWKKERGDYDPTDADYLKRAALAEARARSLVVYYCCPLVSAGKACATDDEIHAYVAPLLTQDLQSLIALTAQGGGMRLLTPSEAANFTGPDGSEN